MEIIEEDWEKMAEFADKLINHAFIMSRIVNVIRHPSATMDELRISIVLLDQATELLMKAYLMKCGYYIEEPDINKIKSIGFKDSTKVIEFLKENKTLDFEDVLVIVKKLLPPIDKEKIGDFHHLRNEIYHRSLVREDLDKEAAIRDFIPALKTFYEAAFEGRFFPNADDTFYMYSERYRG